jgi:hypothetical protein
VWLPQGIENKRTRELSEDELTTLRDEVEKYTIEGDLRRFNALNIKRLKEIQCYRGRRHIAVSTPSFLVAGWLLCRGACADIYSCRLAVVQSLHALRVCTRGMALRCS